MPVSTSTNLEPKVANDSALLTGVRLAGIPEGGPAFQFRCHLVSRALDGTALLEQFTQPRANPNWLVRYPHSSAAPISVAVQFRSASKEDWATLGTIQANAVEALGREMCASADFPIPACRFAPALSVQLQFSRAEPTDSASSGPVRGRVFTRSTKVPVTAAQIQTAELQAVHHEAERSAVEAIANVTELTPAEQVIVKDTWNKLLGFHDLLMEMFFERILHEEPDLVEAFGDAVDYLPDEFARLFDAAVRKLQPRTEKILREAYRSVPGLSEQESGSVEQLVVLFTNLGMRPRHWLTARKIWIWVLGEIPYLEEYERDNLRLGQSSAAFKFFSRHIVSPALRANREYDQALTSEMIAEMSRCGAALALNAKEVGIEFYRLLFTQSPETIEYFGRTDMDHLAEHLFQAIAFLTDTLKAGDSALGALRHLAAVHTENMVPPEAYAAIGPPLLEVMEKYYPAFDDKLANAWAVLLQRVVQVLSQPMSNRRRLLGSAREWLDTIAGEQEWLAGDKERRWNEIVREVRATGAYTHTYEELAYGAQLAWRNSPKCIARISWRNMIVRDLRHVTDPDEMFRECLEHIRMGINGGNMQIVMNVFRPKRPKERWGPRIWNSQYLRYAGYLQSDGTVLGDGANVKLTQAIERLGWTPPEPRGRFDLLPLVIDIPGQVPKLYTLGETDGMQVPIEHPAIPEFAALGLKWFVIPAIANFRMDIGGIRYGCIPFNGWFMETEIARNLWESGRYGQAENIARLLGLDTTSEQSLWRDRAFLELNIAVLHSFSKAKVSLVDHQTAAKQFMAHDLREKKAGRECPAQWSWVVPPAGGSSTPVWHHEMRDFYMSPHYHYAADKWAVLGEDIEEISEHPEIEGTRDDLLILYGSETGTAEAMARQASRRLQAYRPKVIVLNDCDPLTLMQASFALVITSTFGEGELPANAKRFATRLREFSHGALAGLNYTVLALGSTVYPHFCAGGAMLDREFARLGANRVIALHRGDEIKGQAATFQAWLDLSATLLGEDPTAAKASQPELRIRFTSPSSEAPTEARIAKVRPGYEAKVIENRELLKEIIPGSRSTRLIAFDLADSGLIYETGDHLSVYPRNSSREISRLCVRLGIDPNAWFSTALVAPNGAALEGDTPYPEPTQVKRVLMEDFDLSVREPVQGLLSAMEQAAEEPGERAKLHALVEGLSDAGDPEKAATLSREIVEEYLTVADLLEAFPSSQIGLDQMIALLPRQKPRLYSISSGSLTHPNEIQVTIGVVQVANAAGKVRQGVCSTFLASLDPANGDSARIAVRTSTFRPPADLDIPMLMVGPGTGLSPLIGFLQHRGAQMRQLQQMGRDVSLGNARLYFGCRDSNDYLYRRELETWRDRGIISHLAVAFSRASEKKAYVQHLIAEHGPEIWQVLGAPRCHYYVCGDAKMADDVFDALMSIAQREGGLSRGAAIDFFDKMKSEKRYHADVWGVTLNFKQAMGEVREAKYQQGARWLRQVNAAETAGDEKADQFAGHEGVPVTSA